MAGRPNEIVRKSLRKKKILMPLSEISTQSVSTQHPLWIGGVVTRHIGQYLDSVWSEVNTPDENLAGYPLLFRDSNMAMVEREKMYEEDGFDQKPAKVCTYTV